LTSLFVSLFTLVLEAYINGKLILSFILKAYFEFSFQMIWS